MVIWARLPPGAALEELLVGKGGDEFSLGQVESSGS